MLAYARKCRLFRRRLLLTFLLFPVTAAHGQQIEWLTSLDEAKQIAQQTGRPLMYDFTASWCGPCKRMDREFWPKQEVVALSKQFVCVKVDFDREKTFAKKYGINAIPNVVFTDPWGRGLLGQKGFGAGTEAEILDKIRVLPKDFSTLRDAGNTLQTNEKDLKALHSFAEFYQDQKLYWLGSEYYLKLMYLEADPLKRENILVNLAFNHLRMSEPMDAIERIEALRKEYPASPQGDLHLFGLILAHTSKNNTEIANRYFSELKTKYPKSKYVGAAEESFRR